MHEDQNLFLGQQFEKLMEKFELAEQKTEKQIAAMILEELCNQIQEENSDPALIPIACTIAFDTFVRKKRAKRVEFYKKTFKYSLTSKETTLIILRNFYSTKISEVQNLEGEMLIYLDDFLSKKIESERFLTSYIEFMGMLETPQMVLQ